MRGEEGLFTADGLDHVQQKGRGGAGELLASLSRFDWECTTISRHTSRHLCP
jgi:hypothetical protein